TLPLQKKGYGASEGASCWESVHRPAGSRPCGRGSPMRAVHAKRLESWIKPLRARPLPGGRQGWHGRCSGIPRARRAAMSAHRYVAVVKLPESAPRVLVRGDAMVLGVEGSPLLASAKGEAAVLKDDLDLLRDRQARVKNGGTVARALRDEVLEQVKRDV